MTTAKINSLTNENQNLKIQIRDLEYQTYNLSLQRNETEIKLVNNLTMTKNDLERLKIQVANLTLQKFQLSAKLEDFGSSVIRYSTRYVNHYDSMSFTTLPACFDECKRSSSCAAASFALDRKFPVNCFMFKNGGYTKSLDEEDNWISLKKIT